MGGLKYCFEREYVVRTLKGMKEGLAVIDSEGIATSHTDAALKRGIKIYDYLNFGALERERPYYSSYKDLRLAEYEGWVGEYWVDVTSQKWKQHIVDEAKAKRDRGAIGLYFDNGDIYWMAREGFKEQGAEMMRKSPSAEAVYRAALDVMTTIRFDLGMVVMPNGADDLVRRIFKDSYGKALVQAINQEGCLYENFKKQAKDEMKYRKAYMDWARQQDLYVRGIEYCDKASQKATCILTYKHHKWQGLYISKHKDLRGD